MVMEKRYLLKVTRPGSLLGLIIEEELTERQLTAIQDTIDRLKTIERRQGLTLEEQVNARLEAVGNEIKHLRRREGIDQYQAEDR